MSKVDFKTASYFSAHFRYTSIAFALLGFALLFERPVWGAILCLLSLVFTTTHYRFGVDPGQRVYHDYLWMLGFPFGKKKKFQKVEYLFVKNSNVSRTMRMRVAHSTIQKEVADGYVKFSPDEKVHLLALDSKAELTNRLKIIASQLGVKLMDYSEGTPREV